MSESLKIAIANLQYTLSRMKINVSIIEKEISRLEQVLKGTESL